MHLNRSLLTIFVSFSFFCCIGLLHPWPNYAEDKTVLEVQQLSQLFEKYILADLPFARDDIEINNFTSRPKSLELPPGEIEYRFDMGPMTGRLGLRTFYLEVLVKNSRVGKVKMTGNVQLYGNVISAARTLKRGSVLSRQDLNVSRRNVTMLGTDLVLDPSLVVGKQLKTTLQPGSILFTSLLKTPQIIKRGEMVVILAKSDRIHVSVPGKARSAGALGDYIKVKNMMSRREVYAKIINRDEVQVEF